MKLIFSLFFFLCFFSKSEARVEAHIVVNAKTGAVLSAASADTLTPPASLTKMMTSLLVFKALDKGELTFAHRMPISKFAAGQAPCKLGLRPGQSLTVREALLAMATRSANDVAEAVAEFMGGGNRHQFYRQMNKQAKQLGMRHTTFGNASGLPHNHNWTTARDMAILGLALQRYYAHHFHFFGVKTFHYKGQRIHNHNKMLDSFEGVNGIKTGLTNKSGSNIVTSCVRSGHRLVGVVLGGRNWRERDAKMAGLLSDGFGRVSGNISFASKTSLGQPVEQFKKIKAILDKKGRNPALADSSARYALKLSVFKDKEKARNYALGLVKKYPRYMRDKTAALEYIKGAGVKKYRPKFMPFSKTQGNAFCALVRSGGGSCMLVENDKALGSGAWSAPTKKAFPKKTKKPLKAKGRAAKKRPHRR